MPILIGKRLKLLFKISPNKALRKAFILFCTPRKGAVLPDQVDFLDAAEDEIVTVNDIFLQTYRWQGTEDTILLVHGWESNTHRWKKLIQTLQKEKYTIIAFDAPAHGYSSGTILNVPLYAECLKKIVDLYRPNHIIGHSVGGMCTAFYQYTYQNPEVDKLILLAPPSELTLIMKGYQRTLRLPDRFMEALDDYFKNRFGYKFKEFSIAQFSKKIQNKGLLIHDKFDDIAPYSAAIAINENWQNGTLITTENYGHSLFNDTIDEHIVNFINS
ncbi:alpha/beta fold hydrolase [Aquimarina sp. W85]|uniref:alpha/beta fold hydrolase n=1 Tax=Aquimarina rhodophyticola TaxID=3342246 RepID=UPI0036712D08